ncbi:MAG: DUF1801 domain-containing protein [Bacteroidota bacterium]
MPPAAITPDQYYSDLQEDRKEAMLRLREVIGAAVPEGFSEQMSYGMPGFVVPHSVYPAGYHCDPKQALPFISLASQKNFIAIYHMGLYSMPELMEWFTAEFPKHSSKKADMGKSCLRFKKPEDIPFALIGELAGKVTPQQWISHYEAVFKSKR